jgi:hypothetical protein
MLPWAAAPPGVEGGHIRHSTENTQITGKIGLLYCKKIESIKPLLPFPYTPGYVRTHLSCTR